VLTYLVTLSVNRPDESGITPPSRESFSGSPADADKNGSEQRHDGDRAANLPFGLVWTFAFEPTADAVFGNHDALSDGDEDEEKRDERVSHRRSSVVLHAVSIGIFGGFHPSRLFTIRPWTAAGQASTLPGTSFNRHSFSGRERSIPRKPATSARTPERWRLHDGLDGDWHWGDARIEDAAQAAQLIEPGGPLTRHLVVPHGGWTLLLTDGPHGTDLGVLPRLTARELGCVAIRAVCVADGKEPYPARILEVFGPEGTPPLLAIRAIVASNDGGSWIFETSGNRLPFEDQEQYKARRKSDRLTPQLLLTYLSRLGVPVNDEPAWRSALVIEVMAAASRRRRRRDVRRVRSASGSRAITPERKCAGRQEDRRPLPSPAGLTRRYPSWPRIAPAGHTVVWTFT
jgi:hypothetical protein